MAVQIGELVVKVKVVGIGGKRRLKFLAMIAKILGIELEAKVEV